MTEQPLERIPIEPEKADIDLALVKKVYMDLMTGGIDTVPGRMYQLHKKGGGRFNQESFFLDWLETEVRLSLAGWVKEMDVELAYSIKDIMSVKAADFFGAWNVMTVLSKVIKKSFPGIDPGRERLTLKLWRFRKSGILPRLEREVSFKQPSRTTWNNIQLAQSVADYVYAQRGRKASQRELCRYTHKPADILEGFRPWLEYNYGIEWEEGKRKNQVIYHGTRRTSRGKPWRILSR